MRFRDIIDYPCGIRDMFSRVNIISGYSHKVMLNSLMMKDISSIELSYRILEDYISMIKSDRTILENIQFKLNSLRDIEGTLGRLSSGEVIDEIDCFEIKNLSFLWEDIISLLDNPISERYPYDLSEVRAILDPDNLRHRSFYIYDSYDNRLAGLRLELKANADDAQCFSRIKLVESEVLQAISKRLQDYCDLLLCVLHSLAQIDINCAKAQLILSSSTDYCIGQVSTDGTSIISGFTYPEIEKSLQSMGKVFQKGNIKFSNNKPTCIIGANMGGKTIALKSIALCQLMFQFGFPIAAQSALMQVFDEVYLLVSDSQDCLKGLSSFASEMVRIDSIIKSVNSGNKVLALLDEPARTTNPPEGTALVGGLLQLFENEDNISLIITTHYTIDKQIDCKLLKVVGIKNGRMNYALEDGLSSDVPHEALNIAEELHIDSKWINNAKQLLNK